jgi:mRNA interferase RelE/StbE
MIEWEYSPSFKKSFKKLDKPLQKAVEIGLQDIKGNPEIGSQKKGDLSEVFVHKIKVKTQQILIAYVYDKVKGLFVAVGFHENFYRELKR